MTAIGAQYIRRACIIGGLAGHTIGRFTAGFARFFLDDFPFDLKGLRYMRKIQIVIERGRDPDAAGFDTTMIVISLGRIGFVMVILKRDPHVIEQGFLIAFNRKVIMRLALFDQIAGEVALGE